MIRTICVVSKHDSAIGSCGLMVAWESVSKYILPKSGSAVRDVAPFTLMEDWPKQASVDKWCGVGAEQEPMHRYYFIRITVT